MRHYLSLDWNSNGVQIVSGSDDGGVRVWNTSSAEPIQMLQSYIPDIWSVSWNPDDRLVAIGDSQTAIRVWDVTRNAVVANYTGHGDSVAPNIRRGIAVVEWSPNGSFIASGGYDGQVIVQSATPDNAFGLKRFSARGGFVGSLSWSPDNQALLGADGAAALWDVRTGEILRTYNCSQDETDTFISVAMLNLEGSLVAGVENDSLICIWDANSGRLINTISNARDVYKVVWRPGSELITIIESGGAEGIRRVRVLDALTGDEYATIEGQSNAESIAWSPDGTKLAIGHAGGTIGIWSVQAENDDDHTAD